MAILIGGGGGSFLNSLRFAAHCSPLLHGNFSQGGGGGQFLKSPPIAAQLLHHFTPSEQNTPALLFQFTRHRQITHPPPPPTRTTKWEYFREVIRPGTTLELPSLGSLSFLLKSSSMLYDNDFPRSLSDDTHLQQRSRYILSLFRAF